MESSTLIIIIYLGTQEKQGPRTWSLVSPDCSDVPGLVIAYLETARQQQHTGGQKRQDVLEIVKSKNT